VRISISVVVDSRLRFLNNPAVRLLFIFFASFLAACATLPGRPPVENPQAAWGARQAELMHVNAWEIRGRVALRTADTGLQASLQWVRAGDSHRIDLAGPLGGGRVRLRQDASGAELRDSTDKVYRDASAERLLARTTGWQLPLDGLNYWVLGLPAPDTPATSELDAWGRLTRLGQRGWDIRFLDYAIYSGHELPSRVFITRGADAGTGGTLDLRLVVETWTFDHLPAAAPK